MKISSRPAAALAAALALAACGQASTSGPDRTAAVAAEATADAVAAANAATGTMLCAPSQDQLDACAGLAAADACSLTSLDGLASVAGTCRVTIDGLSLACGHVPPGPPAALVEACAGLAAGAACSVTEPDGDTHDGACVTARDGATLVCGRAHLPPQAALDACATLAAGDACAMTRPSGSTLAGVCSLGPAGTGALACLPPQLLRPSTAAACAGRAAGDACAIGSPNHPVAGTCVTPTAGGDPVCQAACAAFGGPFRYRHHGAGPLTPPPPPLPILTACEGLAAGDACAFAKADGTDVDGTCRTAPVSGVLVCAPCAGTAPVAPPPPPPPLPILTACEGLAAGDACTVTRLDGTTVAGACRASFVTAALLCATFPARP